MITLLYGSDAYRLREAAVRYAAEHRSQYSSVPQVFDAAAEAERLCEAAATPSFFAERGLLVGHNPVAGEGFCAELERLADGGYLAGDMLLVQRTPVKPTAAQSKDIARLKKLATAVEAVEPLSGKDLAAWVSQFCSQRGKTIDSAAAAQLTARTNNDTWTLANELEKLCAYAESAVTVAAVDTLVPKTAALDQWELSNALAGHDKRAAMTALWRRATDGTPEPLLVGAVASAVRTLCMIRDLTGRGQPAAAIAKLTGLHPFVVSRNMRGAALYEPVALRQALLDLANLDRFAKSGRADTVDGLFGILLGL